MQNVTGSTTRNCMNRRHPPRWRATFRLEHSRLPTNLMTRFLGADSLMEAMHHAACIARDLSYDDPDEEGSQVATLIALRED